MILTLKCWREIEKFGLKPAFWKILAGSFGYVNNDSPNLTDFLLGFSTTDLYRKLGVSQPSVEKIIYIQQGTVKDSSAKLPYAIKVSDGSRVIVRILGPNTKIEDEFSPET